ncbi:MAG: hypothetical protein WD226_05210 [Planctomycetota bacterium]
MKRALVAALALPALVIALEAGVRIFDLGPERTTGTTPDLFVAHPTRGYALRAGFSGTSVESGEALEIDSLGLRRRPRAAPPDATRVLALGDGQTFGLGVEAHEAWPAVTEDLLTAAGRSIEFVNAGAPGYHARQSVDQLRELLPLLEPDLVLWAIYPGNDVAALWNERPRRVVAGLLVEDGAAWSTARTWLHRHSRAWRALVEPRGGGEPTDEAERRASIEAAMDWDIAFAFALAEKPAPEGVEEAWSRFEAALTDARAACAEHGVALELIVLPAAVQVDPLIWREIHDRLRLDPAAYDLDRPLERLRALARAAELTVHDPSERLAAWAEASRAARMVPYDGFLLSRWGQRLVAQALAESMVQQGSL